MDMKLNLKTGGFIQRQRRLLIIGIAVLAMLSVVGLSWAGRLNLMRIFSPGTSATTAAVVPQGGDSSDPEEKAKGKHGWGSPPQSSIQRGIITYFDPSGAVARRGNLTVYRKYPNQIRVDVEQDGLIQTQGIDTGSPWQARSAASLTDAQNRDIRGWLRIWPDHLFIARSSGGAYRELGQTIEQARPGPPGHRILYPRPDRVLDLVEVDDDISPPGSSSNRGGEKRTVSYLVDRERSVVYAARWLEPDDPTQSADSTAPSTEIRIDFGDWKRVGGVLWPMRITRYLGGRLDWNVELREVLVNQQLPAAIFQMP
jgi:hypothetical protein